MTIKLASFTGESPRTAPRLLPDTGAQTARSVRLEDGELAPYRRPFLVQNLRAQVTTVVKTIYRHLGEWLAWDKIVHCVPGPVAQDRLYYTGDGKPKMLVDGKIYGLALAAPTAKLTAAVTGTVDTTLSATRLYVYTRVTAFGEESEPSPITDDVVVSPGLSVTLSGFQAAPTDREFVSQRIYRSQSGTGGGTNLYFLAERAETTDPYVDTLPSTSFAEPLPSLEWNTPPDDLTGLVALPNGIMAGYVGKDLYFCEPFRPHAWPVKYMLSANYDITGLAVSGTTLVVGTKGVPVLVGGTTPDTMTMEHLDLKMPCISTQGMVDMGYAILYPSNDGLVMVQDGMPNLVSQSLLTLDQWKRMDPATMVCGQHNGRLHASYEYAEPDGTIQAGVLIFDISGQQPFLIRSPHNSTAMFYDLADNNLYMAIGTDLYQWDALQSQNDVYTYRSKAFVTPEPTSFGVIMIEADMRINVDAELAAVAAAEKIKAANIALFARAQLGGAVDDDPVDALTVNLDNLQEVPFEATIAVNIYADGEFLATITTIGQPERIPPMLARQWEIEVTGTIAIDQITLARTAQELRTV